MESRQTRKGLPVTSEHSWWSPPKVSQKRRDLGHPEAWSDPTGQTSYFKPYTSNSPWGFVTVARSCAVPI
jgi:hypothetical protein